MSGRQWSVSIRPDVGNRSERGERSPSCQWSPLCRYSPVSCPPVLLSSCIPLGCRYHYPKEIEAYRNNRSEGVSGRQWSVSIRPDVGNRSERGERSPSCQWSPLCRYSPVSCPPVLLSSCIPLGCRYHYPKEIEAYRSERASLSVFSCVPVLPMMSPPMMMHKHTGASLSVIACVCYSCRPCRLYSFGVSVSLPERD